MLARLLHLSGIGNLSRPMFCDRIFGLSADPGFYGRAPVH